MAGVSLGRLNDELGYTHVLEEDLEDTTRLLVNEARDTLHTTTASETANSLWLQVRLSRIVAEREHVRAW